MDHVAMSLKGRAPDGSSSSSRAVAVRRGVESRLCFPRCGFGAAGCGVGFTGCGVRSTGCGVGLTGDSGVAPGSCVREGAPGCSGDGGATRGGTINAGILPTLPEPEDTGDASPAVLMRK